MLDILFNKGRIRAGRVRADRRRAIFFLIALAGLLPSALVLWFTSLAIRNEQLAAAKIEEEAHQVWANPGNFLLALQLRAHNPFVLESSTRDDLRRSVHTAPGRVEALPDEGAEGLQDGAAAELARQARDHQDRELVEEPSR